MPGIIPPGPGIGQAQGGYDGGTGAATTAPAGTLPADVFKGYADLRNSVARHLNRHLYKAAKLDAVTLRTLNRKRKVRR